MSKPNPYLKYSGLAFQMLAPILGGVYLGQYADGHWFCSPEEQCVVGTVVFSLLGTAAGLYLALKELID